MTKMARGAALLLMLSTVARTHAQEEVATAPFVSLSVETEAVIEGEELTMALQSSAEVISLTAYYRAYRTPRGTWNRGIQQEIVGQRAMPTTETLTWKVPWIDALRFRVFLRGHDASGKVIAETNVPLKFCPKELAQQTRDAIYVDLGHRTRQRLYRMKGGELVQVAICSGSSTNYRKRSGGCGGRIHDHLGWFRIIQKDPDHISTFDPDWIMPYALRFYRAHFIHATSRRMYRYLGRPASHGCIRLHRVDAKRLYRDSRVGDRVYVY